MINLIDKLYNHHQLNREEWTMLLENRNKELSEYLAEKSSIISKSKFGNGVFVRGLIEFTNHCQNDCYYCGIRKSNINATRYRLSDEEILECCKSGYELGFRTFVLQGGEDLWYSTDKVCRIVERISQKYMDCAITLSIGERSYADYKAFFECGANRYLLRHETATNEHYKKLHPQEMLLENRKQCLYNLKEIGYQVGTGFMVGSPYQTTENLVEDLLFIEQLQPHMVGLGPFISHKDTKFKDEKSGTLELTTYLIGLIRLMLPKALIPATTSVGTIDKQGRELAILSGANVVMPNLSPISVRKQYDLYDNKICTGEEAAECRGCLQGRINGIGYELLVDRGDYA